MARAVQPDFISTHVRTFRGLVDDCARLFVETAETVELQPRQRKPKAAGTTVDSSDASEDECLRKGMCSDSDMESVASTIEEGAANAMEEEDMNEDSDMNECVPKHATARVLHASRERLQELVALAL